MKLNKVKVKTAERQIREREGFRVIFRYPGGQRVPVNLRVVSYDRWQKATRRSWTIREWKEKKFSLLYPDIDCDVFEKWSRQPVSGKRVLRTVRDSYL